MSDAPANELDAQLDPREYAHDTLSFSFLLKELGFIEDEGEMVWNGDLPNNQEWTEKWHFVDAVGRIYKVQLFTSKGNIYVTIYREDGAHLHTYVYKSSEIRQLRSFLQRELGKGQLGESDEDNIDPKAYAMSTVDIDAIMQEYGFKYEGASPKGKRHWTKNMKRRVTLSVIYDPEHNNVNFRKLKQSYSDSEDGFEYQVMDGSNTSAKPSDVQRALAKMFEITEADDEDPVTYANRVLDPYSVVQELGFTLTDNKKFSAFSAMATQQPPPQVWIRRKGNYLERVSIQRGHGYNAEYDRFRVNPNDPEDLGRWISGAFVFGAKHLRDIITKTFESTSDAAQVIHELLDAEVDAFDPKAQLSRLAPNRCPNCGSSAITDADAASGLRDCFVCGIHFDPLHPDDFLGEIEESEEVDAAIDPATYAAQTVDPFTILREEGFKPESELGIDMNTTRHARNDWYLGHWAKFVDDIVELVSVYETVGGPRASWEKVRFKRRKDGSVPKHGTVIAHGFSIPVRDLRDRLRGNWPNPQPDRVVESADESADDSPESEVKRLTSDIPLKCPKCGSSSIRYSSAYNASYCDACDSWSDVSKDKQTVRENDSPLDAPENALPSIIDQIDVPRIRITYSRTTPESAANGDVSEAGWEDEEGLPVEPSDDEESVADRAYVILQNEGALYASSYHFHPGIWYSTGWQDIDYITGEQEERNFHLVGFTENEERELFSRFTRNTGRL